MQIKLEIPIHNADISILDLNFAFCILTFELYLSGGIL